MGCSVRFNVPLAPYSWWKIGGLADAFIDVRSEQQLLELLTMLREESIPWYLIGRGTNILFDDAGFRGCIIRLGEGFSCYKFHDDSLSAQAGCWVPALALAAARRNLSGLEHTIGIPASLGGLICMNGGSQRKGIGDIIDSVTILTPDLKIQTIQPNDCVFAYRQSRFQNSGEIVLGAEIKFQHNRTYGEQRRELLKILRDRNSKFPRKQPSCGSVFKSSPELYEAYGPPGKIIEDLGFKGKRMGGIIVSPIHANFIVNTGGGGSVDVLHLVEEIKASVLQKTGVELEQEFKYLDSVSSVLN